MKEFEERTKKAIILH